MPGWEPLGRLRTCRSRAWSPGTLTHGEILGWAALAPVSRRPCYRGVTENSIYVARGQRAGAASGAPSSKSSSRRADELGDLDDPGRHPRGQRGFGRPARRAAAFRVVGTRERIAKKRGDWCDVVLMERARVT